MKAYLAGKCRGELFLDIFGEDLSTLPENPHGCDVCDTKAAMHDCNVALHTLIDALDTIGEKGELKIVQWIRGSSLAWTDQYNKNAMSYGNGGAHLYECHVLGLVEKQLRSVIEKCGHHSIQGIIVVQEEGRDVAVNRKSVLLPQAAASVCCKETGESSHGFDTSHINVQVKSKGKARVGKGTHGLSIVRNLLADKEKWTTPRDVKDCHFLGTSGGQSAFYFEDCQALYSTCPADPHYLWADIQFSKGKVNNYEATVKVNGDEKSKLSIALLHVME